MVGGAERLRRSRSRTRQQIAADRTDGAVPDVDGRHDPVRADSGLSAGPDSTVLAGKGVDMERPRVVMSVGASVDGKVTLTREQTLTAQPSGQVWADMVPAAADRLRADLLDLVRQHYGCNATLEGSGSLVADGV